MGGELTIRRGDDGRAFLDGVFPKRAEFSRELLALHQPWLKVRRGPKRHLIDLCLANGRAVYRVDRWKATTVEGALVYTEP